MKYNGYCYSCGCELEYPLVICNCEECIEELNSYERELREIDEHGLIEMD